MLMPAEQVLYMPVPLDSVASSLPSMLQVSADMAAAAAPRPRPPPRPAAPSPPSTDVAAAAAAARPRPAPSPPATTAAIAPAAKDAAPQRLPSRLPLHPAASALGDRVPPKAPGPAYKCAKGQIYLLKGQHRISDGKSWRCVHYRQPSQCQSCGGVGVCEHGKRRAACPECQSKDNRGDAKSASARGAAVSGTSAGTPGTPGTSSNASSVAAAGPAAGPRPPAHDPPTRRDVEQQTQPRDKKVTPAAEAQTAAEARTAQAAMPKRKGIGLCNDGDVQPPLAKKKLRPWTTNEIATLISTVQEHGLGDWEQKAVALGTGRSASAVEQKYYLVTRDVSHTRPTSGGSSAMAPTSARGHNIIP